MKRRNRLIAGTAVLFLMLLLLPAGVFSRVWADTDTESYFLEDVANQKLQKVETAQWLVRVNKTVKSGKNKIEAGSYATVIKRDYRRLTGASLVQFPDSEETIRIKNTSLTWIKDLCVSKDYNERTKIEYVNRKGYSSKTGRPTGRPPIEFPEHWDEVYSAWKAGHITAVQAMMDLHLRKNSFYKLVKRFEAEHTE